jgi:hypothetical protein
MSFTTVYGGYFNNPCVIDINGELSTYNNELDKVYNKLNKINNGNDQLIFLETKYTAVYACNYSNYNKYANYIMKMDPIDGYKKWKLINLVLNYQGTNNNYIKRILAFQRETATEVTCQNKC